MGGLEIPHVRATSPTLAEVMRNCQLRAGLSRIPGSSDFVLGNPKAWLGMAYHEVLEKIVEVNLAKETLEAAVERLWNEAVAAPYQRACGHLLDHRFGLPPTWPGYHLVRASVLLRARDLVAAREAVNADALATIPEKARGQIREIREHEFAACGGKLIGRPDVIREKEVVDYKSGAVVDYDDGAQAEVAKAGYVRQLRIYGYLVKETLGWWPRRGLLLPLVGAGVEVAFEPAQCEREALDAVALLDAYNAKVAACAEPVAFASPSPQTCKWCPFKLVCPPFWRDVSPAWSGQLDGAVVEGTVDEVPCSIHSGAAMALSVNVDAGSEVHRQFQIAPLNPAMHNAIATVGVGERVRLVGLRLRPDGTLVPSQRTVLACVSDLPLIDMGK